MEQMKGYRFITDGSETRRFSNIHRLGALPFTFKTLLASVDAIVTKPGYGTVVEAVALGLPVLYVRRYNFADEQPLVDFLMRYGRACELSLDDFMSGRWQTALDSLLAQTPIRPVPSCSGAADAAKRLARFF
jgi:UDP-N-acetylglucosamine:LPS N-acetylglucosamine transferase